MTNVNMFEYAARNKVRFSFKGSISVEDLWDLTPEQLDTIYKDLVREQKQSEEESLLVTKNEKQDELLTVKIGIIRHIVSVKLEEKAAAIKANEIKERKQKIMAIMASKQDQALESSSLEDLQKMLDELG